MSNSVCPWWIGYFLLNPLRNIIHSPEKVLKNYVKKEMCVLDIGCGMGYFSIPMARIVEGNSRVLSIDLQEKMLRALKRRAVKANLINKIETRLCHSNSLEIGDFTGKIDFALAFAVVHEVPDKDRLFSEIFQALKPEGSLLIAEPKGHVSEKDFSDTVDIAQKAGLSIIDRPEIGKSYAVLLKKL